MCKKGDDITRFDGMALRSGDSWYVERLEMGWDERLNRGRKMKDGLPEKWEMKKTKKMDKTTEVEDQMRKLNKR